MLDTNYQTGNRKMDEKIRKALSKDGVWKPKHNEVFGVPEYDTSVNKYHVSEKEQRTYRDGTLFASKKEMERWDYLLKLERAGQIKDLKRQVPFVLQEEFINRQWGEVQHILYVADFTYINLTFRHEYENRLCVEDSKGGVLTSVYLLKRKMFLYKYGDLLFFEV